MITFDQLKAVLLQGEIEIQSDNPLLSDKEWDNFSSGLVTKFEKAKTLLDLIHIYENKSGYETYDAYESIINALMVTATLD
jgi:hypothetical protein